MGQSFKSFVSSFLEYTSRPTTLEKLFRFNTNLRRICTNDHNSLKCNVRLKQISY